MTKIDFRGRGRYNEGRQKTSEERLTSMYVYNRVLVYPYGVLYT